MSVLDYILEEILAPIFNSLVLFAIGLYLKKHSRHSQAMVVRPPERLSSKKKLTVSSYRLAVGIRR